MQSFYSPVIATVCMAWSSNSYSRAHKITLCFFDIFETRNTCKLSQCRYFKMIICFQQRTHEPDVDGSAICIHWLIPQSQISLIIFKLGRLSYQAIPHQLRTDKATADRNVWPPVNCSENSSVKKGRMWNWLKTS